MNNIFIAQKIFEEENDTKVMLCFESNGSCSVGIYELNTILNHLRGFDNYIDLIEYLETTKL